MEERNVKQFQKFRGLDTMFRGMCNSCHFEKLASFFRSMFVSTSKVRRFFTLKEFFDKGGYIYTLMPGESGKTYPCYYKYTSFETFIADYPERYWLVGAKTEYILDDEKAYYQTVPEEGFCVRVRKSVPNYPNVALAILCVGLLILLVTCFSISTVVGFMYVGLLTSVIGYILHHWSTHPKIIKH